MRQIGNLKQYSVLEINGILESLRASYDIVRVVDVEECRILEIRPDGSIQHGCNCFDIWNRKGRCENCSSYRSCMVHTPMDKTERLGGDRESIHSIPIYLELLNGELQMCVIECVRYAGEAAADEGDRGDGFAVTHDVLTRLYTQEKLFREIRQRLMDRPSDDYLLVMGNIRNFRLVNKLFGFECGNRVLAGIADILREELTHEEVYGRYRDDRFVALIRRDRFDEWAFSQRLQQVKGLLNSPIYTLQVKLGVYDIDDPEMPVASMLEHAEVAVGAIRNHRNQLIAHFEPAMMARRQRDRSIVSSFQRALDDGEFVIYLQPQVRDGRVVGAEALVRWQKSDGSVMLPGEFLDVLNKSELLSHLDMHVWQLAVRQLAQWKGTALEGLYLSVNVDQTDFYHVDVPGALAALCRQYGVDAGKLRVEITETALIEDIKNESQMVERLHDEGFVVEIDDFGKGYSSLSLLKDIRADVLKIDMGFVQDDRNRSRSRVILASVINMAYKLDMDVITEGVETQAQAELIAGLGCRAFQGYYYSRPVPVEDFEALMAEDEAQG